MADRTGAAAAFELLREYARYAERFPRQCPLYPDSDGGWWIVPIRFVAGIGVLRRAGSKTLAAFETAHRIGPDSARDAAHHIDADVVGTLLDVFKRAGVIGHQAELRRFGLSRLRAYRVEPLHADTVRAMNDFEFAEGSATP